MFTQNVLFNVVDAISAHLLITGGAEEVFAEVRYLPSKSDGQGGDVGVAPFDAGTHTIPPRQTVRVPVDLRHTAFDGGYGAVQVASTDGASSPSFNPLTVFLALRTPRQAAAVGSSAFEGNSFRIPVLAPPAQNPTQRFKVAITTRTVAQIIEVTAPGKPGPTQFNVGPSHTFLWDSDLQTDVDVTQSGYIQVTVPGGGNCVVSAAVYRGGTRWGHIYPAVLKSA